jgi:2-octaprenyl-6-methoxyphenol hydroxylase
MFPSLTAESSSVPRLHQTDVVIVGGGIVGVTVACALAQTGISIVLLEGQSREQTLARDRAYALSLASAQVLQQIGVWERLRSRLEVFEQIRLSDGAYPGVVWFCPEDLPGSTELGYIGEHGPILSALYDRLSELSLAEVWAPATALHTTYQPDQVFVEVERTTADWHGAGLLNNRPQVIQAQLVIAADGPQSPMRQAAGIPTQGWAYWQSCLTCVIQTETSHLHIAQERFWPQGPLAVLPLLDQRVQIVWTAPHRAVQDLAALPEADFLKQLQQVVGHQLGSLHLTNHRQVFPVRLLQSRTYVQSRLALVGDAAHNCHPVGGQGLNLGIRDAAALAEILTAAFRQQVDLGDLAVLRGYDRWRRWENWLILAFTDVLDRLFSNQMWPLVWLRRIGLEGLRRIPPLRRLILSVMTGQQGRCPTLDRRPAIPLARSRR